LDGFASTKFAIYCPLESMHSNCPCTYRVGNIKKPPKKPPKRRQKKTSKWFFFICHLFFYKVHYFSSKMSLKESQFELK
jgi:hypothetical protein